MGGGDELRGDILGGKVTSSREINHKKQAATKCASIEVFTRASHSGIHRDSSNMCHSDVCCCQIHRKRSRKLDSDVYMTKTSFKIHRGCILKLNPDVSRKHIHRNAKQR